MKKLVAMMVVCISFTTYSQVGFKAGIAMGTPMTKNNDSFNGGFEVGVVYDFDYNLRAELVYEAMFRRYSPLINGHARFMPLTVGLDYGIGNWSVRPFVGLNLGYAEVGYSSAYGKGSSSYFDLAPKFGLNYAINEKIALDANFKFHLLFNKYTNNNFGRFFGTNLGVIIKM